MGLSAADMYQVGGHRVVASRLAPYSRNCCGTIGASARRREAIAQDAETVALDHCSAARRAAGIFQTVRLPREVAGVYIPETGGPSDLGRPNQRLRRSV